MEFVFTDFWKMVVVGVMLYAIIFMTLKKFAFIENEKVSALIAFLSVLIVSFTGIVTYIVSYAITWFMIIFIIAFFIFIILVFLGIPISEAQGMLNKKVLFGVIGFIFVIILFKGFFGVNNVYDLNNPQENPYDVNTEFNTGVDDITGEQLEMEEGWLENFSINSDLLGIVIFFLIIGGAIFFIG
jgi:hypothetical protein